MGFVGIDVEGGRRAGAAMSRASAAAEDSRRQVLGALTLADLSGDAPQQLAVLADSLGALGSGVTTKADVAAAFTVDPQATGPSVEAVGTAVPGAALADPPPGFRPVSPFAGGQLDITVIGDSFISGEGLPGEDAYAGLGNIPRRGVLMANPIHQAHESGALLAVRDLQRTYPEAEIRITFTAEEFAPRTVPPLRETLGPVPVINVTVAAESGADIDSVLGTTANGAPARNKEPESPWDPQILSVTRDTDIIMLSVGGNTRIREGDTEGGFVSLLGETMTPVIVPWWNWSGADEARDLSRGVWPALVRLPELLREVSGRSAAHSETLFAGYPYFINGFDEKGDPLPMPAGFGWPFNHLESKPLPFPLNEINDAENQRSVEFWKQMTLVQQTDAEHAYILPGQRIVYLPQAWDNEHTLTGSNPAVNGWIGPMTAPDARSFHPNAAGQDLYRELFLPPLEAAANRILGTRPEILSPFDSFGNAEQLLERSSVDDTTVDWASPELQGLGTGTELPGLDVVEGGSSSGEPLPPGLYGGFSPAQMVLSDPGTFLSGTDLFASSDSEPFSFGEPATDYGQWSPPPWDASTGFEDLGMTDLGGYDSFSDPLAGMAMSWDSSGFGEGDFGSVEMYSGDSFITTEGFY